MTQPTASSRAGFVKRHGEHLRRDWDRLASFVDVVEAVPGLRTARALACDWDSGEIVYERILDHANLSALTGRAGHPDLLTRAARLLANFHAAPVPHTLSVPRRLQPLEAFDLEPVECMRLQDALPTGFFWGDCWQGNVLVSQDQIYFVDPIANRWLFDVEATVANAGIDLAMLYMSVLFCHPLHRLALLDSNMLVETAEAMLWAYLDAASARGVATTIRRLARQLAVRYIDTCRFRLPAPIALLRRHASHRILGKVDDMLDWS